jgi:hypothetical protein
LWRNEKEKSQELLADSLQHFQQAQVAELGASHTKTRPAQQAKDRLQQYRELFASDPSKL